MGAHSHPQRTHARTAARQVLQPCALAARHVARADLQAPRVRPPGTPPGMPRACCSRVACFVCVVVTVVVLRVAVARCMSDWRCILRSQQALATMHVARCTLRAACCALHVACCTTATRTLATMRSACEYRRAMTRACACQSRPIGPVPSAPARPSLLACTLHGCVVGLHACASAGACGCAVWVGVCVWACVSLRACVCVCGLCTHRNTPHLCSASPPDASSGRALLVPASSGRALLVPASSGRVLLVPASSGRVSTPGTSEQR
jgi:hypothetical protein